jgi:hypothetical protein
VPSRPLRLDSIRRCIPPFWVLGGTRPGLDLRSTSNRDFGGEATMPSDAAMHSSRHAGTGRTFRRSRIARRDRRRPVRWPSKLSPEQRRRGCSPARVMPQADQAIVGWFGRVIPGRHAGPTRCRCASSAQYKGSRCSYPGRSLRPIRERPSRPSPSGPATRRSKRIAYILLSWQRNQTRVRTSHSPNKPRVP